MATFPHDLYTYFYRTRTNNPDPNGDWRWRINFTLVSQNPSTNSSTYRIRHYLQLRNQPSGAQERQWCCGNQVNSGAWSNWEYDWHYGTPPFPIPPGNSEHLVWTQNRTITHESDGKKTAYLRGRGGYWETRTFEPKGYIWMYNTNTLFEFPTIPRAPSYNSINASNITLNSVRLTASIDTKGLSVTGGGWDLSTDGGVTWTYYDGDVYDKTITGLIPGTQYWYRGYVTTSGGGANSNWKTFTTTQQATITNSNVNFDVDNGITINFSNPSGKQVDLYLILADLTIITLRENITSPYVLNLTEDEKNTIFNSSPNSNSLEIIVGLMTDETYYYSKNGIATISNANPIFNNFEYEDINPITLALTGNNQTIIKGYSTLRAIISTSNKAVAQKGASIVSYQLVVGEKQKTVAYSDSTDVNIDLTEIENNIFTVYAIDSRGNSTTKQISPTEYIAYSKVVLSNGQAERTGGIGDETTLKFNGSFLNIDFGSVANDITLSYKYKKTDEDDSKWQNGVTPIVPIKNGNNYSFEGKIAGDKGALGFDSQYSYNIKIIATDKLSSDEYDLILGTGKPNIAIHRDGVSINAPYDEGLGGPLQIKGKRLWELIYPVGAIYISVNNTSPATLFGGTWVAFGAGRTLVGVDSSDSDFNTVEKTGGAKTHTLTINEMPSHRHRIKQGYGVLSGGAYTEGAGYTNTATPPSNTAKSIEDTGGNDAHNNLQPYITVYMWKRTE